MSSKSSPNRSRVATGSVSKRAGFKFLHEFAPDQVIVGMQVFDGRVFVATSQQVFEVVGEELISLPFTLVEEEDEPDANAGFTE